MVVPGKLGDVPDDRGRSGPNLRGEAVGIGLENEIAVVAALDLVLVDFTLAEVGNEDLPDPRRAAIAHGMSAAVPVIEIADDADPLRVGSPDGEVNSAKALMGSEMGTEPLVIAVVRPFAEQVQVKIGEDRPKEIGIDELPGMSLVVFDPQTIGESALPAGEPAYEKTIGVNSLHRRPLTRLALRQVDDPGRLCLRQEGADDPGIRDRRSRAAAHECPGPRTGPSGCHERSGQFPTATSWIPEWSAQALLKTRCDVVILTFARTHCSGNVFILNDQAHSSQP